MDNQKRTDKWNHKNEDDKMKSAHKTKINRATKEIKGSPACKGRHKLIPLSCSSFQDFHRNLWHLVLLVEGHYGVFAIKDLNCHQKVNFVVGPINLILECVEMLRLFDILINLKRTIPHSEYRQEFIQVIRVGFYSLQHLALSSYDGVFLFFELL